MASKELVEKEISQQATSIFYYDVALPTRIQHTFTYQSEKKIEPGTRVVVPFGPQELIGMVQKESVQEIDPKKLKNVKEIIDPTPFFTPELLKLASWLSHYYMHPLGDVIKTMLPASLSKKKLKGYYLTEKGKTRFQRPEYSYLKKILPDQYGWLTLF